MSINLNNNNIYHSEKQPNPTNIPTHNPSWMHKVKDSLFNASEKTAPLETSSLETKSLHKVSMQDTPSQSPIFTQPSSIRGEHNPKSLELLHAACDKKWDDVEKILLSSTQNNPPLHLNTAFHNGPNKGLHALFLAAEAHQWDVVSSILLYGNQHKQPINLHVARNNGMHALLLATNMKQWDIVVDLLDFPLGNTPPLPLHTTLHEGENKGLHLLSLAAISQEWDVVNIVFDYLVEHKQHIDVNLTPNHGPHQGLTPLFLAVQSKEWDVVQRILDYARQEKQKIEIPDLELNGNIIIFLVQERQWELLNSIFILLNHKISDFTFLSVKTLLLNILEKNEQTDYPLEYFYLHFLLKSNPGRIESTWHELNPLDQIQKNLENTLIEINTFNEVNSIPAELKEMICIEILLNHHPILRNIIKENKIEWLHYFDEKFEEHCKQKDVFQKRRLALHLYKKFIEKNSLNERNLENLTYRTDKKFVLSVINNVQKELGACGFINTHVFQGTLYEKAMEYMNQTPLETSSQGPFFTFNKDAIQGILYRALSDQLKSENLEHTTVSEKKEIHHHRNLLSKKILTENLIEIFRQKWNPFQGEIFNEQCVPELRTRLLRSLHQIQQHLEDHGQIQEHGFLIEEERKEIQRRCSRLRKAVFTPFYIEQLIRSVICKQ